MRLQFKDLITFLKVPAPTTVTLETKFPCGVGGGEVGINNQVMHRTAPYSIYFIEINGL